MKVLALALLAMFFVTFAQARTGTNSGGGGNLYTRNFVQVALETISEIEKNPNGQTYVSNLQKALADITAVDGIELVKELKNPDGTILQKQNLYAYSWPGKIQLLDSIWINWLATVEQAKLHKVDIIHELFRTIDIKMDDGYKITLVELGLGLAPSNQDFSAIEKQNYINLAELLYTGLAAMTGEFDGTEGPLSFVNFHSDIKVRLGGNLSKAANAGLTSAADPKFKSFHNACKQVGGYENQGNCYREGLKKFKNSNYIYMTFAKIVVRDLCWNGYLPADAARCFVAAIPMIPDENLHNAVAGCAYVTGGLSIAKCYLGALPDFPKKEEPPKSKPPRPKDPFVKDQLGLECSSSQGKEKVKGFIFRKSNGFGFLEGDLEKIFSDASYKFEADWNLKKVSITNQKGQTIVLNLNQIWNAFTLNIKNVRYTCQMQAVK